MRKNIQLLAALAVLIAIFVLYFGVYRPRSAELAELSDRVARAEQRLSSAQLHAGDLQQSAAFLPRGGGEEGNGGQRFLSLASDELRRLGIRVNRIEPLGQESEGEFTRRQYRIQLEGRYTQIADFFEYLEALPEMVEIEGFEIRSHEVHPGDRHKATLSLWVTGH